MTDLRVLVNVGPWLPVPPRDYGGIENVVATLIPQLRCRGVQVVLASVGSSKIAVDERVATFAEGQFEHLARRYGDVVGIAHAHMHDVIQALRRLRVDIVHDHLEVVGPSMLSVLGPEFPPTLATLHWDLAKHEKFYAGFQGNGRVFFNAVSRPQLSSAPANIAAQALGTVPLGVEVSAYPFTAAKAGYFLTLSRITPQKGVDVAARICKELGLALRMAGPIAGIGSPEDLFERLADPASELHTRPDVRYYLGTVRPFEDGEQIRWIGSLGGEDKLAVLGRARALLMPIDWEEPGATAAIEALACGTPVIAMRRGALSAIVEHGITGFLADNERDFADCVLRVDEIDPAACRRAAQARFSASRMAGSYMRLYEEVLRRAGG